MLSLLQLARWEDGVDILAVALLAWLAIRYLRRTRVRTALVGLAMLGAVYAVATALELRLTASLFQAFFAVVVLILVVVFQDDLRRFFEQLGAWRPGLTRASERPGSVDLLAQTVSKLALQRTGALIVLPRNEPLERHLEGGVALGGKLSEPLLLSLFDASSPGHDGAVILRDDIVDRFSVHLPLSTNHEALGGRGCRHAAALGLAERCDAVSIVVSEERGTVSVARDGGLRTVSVDDLSEAIARSEAVELGRGTRRRNALLDAAAALVGAILVWVVFVPGSDLSTATFPARVEITNLPGDLVLETVDPTELRVTVRGLRRDLVLADPDELRVRVDAYLARLGRRTFAVEAADVSVPDALEVTDVNPGKVKISLRAPEPPEPDALP